MSLEKLLCGTTKVSDILTRINELIDQDTISTNDRQLLNTAVTNLETATEELETSISTVSGQRSQGDSALQEQIDLLDDLVDSLEAADVIHEQDIADLQQALADTGGATDNQIQAIHGRLNDLETNEAIQDQDIDTLEGKVQSLETNDTTQDQDIDTLEGKVQSLETSRSNLGTAAQEDVVTSSIDTTQGKVPTVGWGGIGGDRLPKQSYGNNLLTLAGIQEFNGFTFELAVDTEGRPDFAPGNLGGLVLKTPRTLIVYSTYPSSVAGNIYIGFYESDSLTWFEQYSSKNSVNPLDYGLGVVTQAEISDLDDISESGMFPVRSGVTANNPLNSYHSSVLRMNSPFLGRGAEILATHGSSGNEMLFRGQFGSTYSDWETVYHSGNSVNALDYGIGGPAPMFTDGSILTSPASGFQYAGSTATDRPANRVGFVFSASTNDDNQARLYIESDGDTYTSFKGAGNQKPWRKLYDDLNTNFNVYGYAGNNKLLLTGNAVNSSTIFFELDLFGFDTPTGISHEGTFRVISTSTLDSYDYDQVTSLSLSTNTSNKKAFVVVSGLSGLEVDREYSLSSIDAQSGFKVNY